MVELITGKSAEAHISSNDDRAFHRANFGQGKYIFQDADNMGVAVTAASGTITISTGSCLWSGMHIRVLKPESLNYVVPAASQIVRVYLHYTKDAETLDEAVEFVVTIDTELAPAIDSLSDNTLEAYTLFCSFTATATAITNLLSGFSVALSHETLEQLIADAHEEKILFSGNAIEGTTINLNESFKNFYELEFIGDNTSSKRILTSQIPETGLNFGVSISGANKFTNATTTYSYFMSAFFSVKSDTAFNFLNSSASVVSEGVQASSSKALYQIIGIGRKR